MLCGAFCSHTALPRVKGMPQPRDSSVFPLKTNNHSDSKATYPRGADGEGQSALQSYTPPVRSFGTRKHLKPRAGADGEGRKKGVQQYAEILRSYSAPPDSARLCTAAVRRSLRLITLGYV